MKRIPFNRPYLTGQEMRFIRKAYANRHLSADGEFTAKCTAWLEKQTGCRKAFLTHTGTAALEMAALLAGIRPGDQVIMPSFTFVSTANAFVLQGGVPVFVEIRPDTLNIDEKKIEKAVTRKTRAIVPVHYGGVGCEMDAIRRVAKKHGLLVIEDAAHALMAGYKGKPLGSFGELAILSFHETKNVSSGEGGALLVNDPRLIARAEVVLREGTDRLLFWQGKVPEYSWVDVGSSYGASELTAAFLWAQIRQAERFTRGRLRAWKAYHEALEPLERKGLLRRPVVPAACASNGHIYHVLLPTAMARDGLLRHLNRRQIMAVFHYAPLHSSAFGRKYARGPLRVTSETSDRILRLPLWNGMGPDAVRTVCRRIHGFFGGPQ